MVAHGEEQQNGVSFIALTRCGMTEWSVPSSWRQTGIVPYVHDVDVGTPLTHVKMSQELNRRRARMHLPAKQFLILDETNQLLPLTTLAEQQYLETGKTYVFKVIEALTFRSNSPAELPDGTKQQAAAIRKIIRGQIRGNQLRLLLKGDVSFLNRAKKVCHDEKRLTSLVLETAKRYHMTPLGSRDDALPVPTQSSPPTKKPSGMPTGSSATTTSKEKTVKPVVLSLPAKNWSHPPMESFRLGIEGVYLEPSMESALAHSRQLSGAKGAVALLTMQPLAAARKVEKVTFTMQMRGHHRVQQKATSISVVQLRSAMFKRSHNSPLQKGSPLQLYWQW